MPSPARISRIHSTNAATLLSLALCCPIPSLAGSLTVIVKQHGGKPLQGAVVTIESEAAAQPAAPIKAIMDQLNLSFVPDVLVIPVHSAVQFPNSDPISHQVYSFSSARQFQLPLYRGKPYPPVTFDKPGVVTLGCNIHDNMLAYIVVTNAPYFGRTDAKGEWNAANLPAGKYRVRAWHSLLNEPQELERRLQTASDHDQLELELTHNLRPAPLTGRPHSWDY